MAMLGAGLWVVGASGCGDSGDEAETATSSDGTDGAGSGADADGAEDSPDGGSSGTAADAHMGGGTGDDVGVAIDAGPPGDDFDPILYGPLCDPCGASGDCAPGAGELDTACVAYGGPGWFCAAACEATGQCPSGYVCADVPTAEEGAGASGSGSWCVRTPSGGGPPYGTCPCTEAAVAAGLTTACYSGGDGSGCAGSRRCKTAGLSACDFSAVSGEETCNGADDDCDGETDEETCDDGLPCTVDACDDGACTSTPQVEGGACDDGDLCTEEDTCSGGVCSGAPRDCDDHQPCTLDTCDSDGGACGYEPAAGGCDDGDACTGPDLCVEGVCQSVWLDDCLFTVVPDVAGCTEGELKPVLKEEALAEVNALRALGGLGPVGYDPASDQMTQRAALMIVANGQIEHFPPPSWHCYTEYGAYALSKSNIHHALWKQPYHRKTPTEVVDSLFKDLGVESLGHRRWILDPFLKQLSFGSVVGAPLVDSDFVWSHGSAMRVIYDEHADLSGQAPTFVAYPVGDYPADLVPLSWYLSFAVLHVPGSRAANQQVDFSTAAISVTGPAGPLVVSDVSWANDFVGLPNHLQWKAAGLATGETYSVDVSGVTYAGSAIGPYAYTFTLVP